jgi:hypothetical protein
MRECSEAALDTFNINGFQRLTEVTRGVKFANGESQPESELTNKRDAA